MGSFLLRISQGIFFNFSKYFRYDLRMLNMHATGCFLFDLEGECNFNILDTCHHSYFLDRFKRTDQKDQNLNHYRRFEDTLKRKTKKIEKPKRLFL